MAIQEVEKREIKGTVGKKRTINAAAEGMVMDIVQAQQYTKPIESTVRELTANAVDAQSEKEKALEILSGKSEASKYFIERDGALYADSKWDPSYYDLNYLNQDKSNVELIYKEGSGGGRCDTFIVKDYGVGIGQRRLEGVLEIGYSTKRNRKDALGAFGLGAKVGLATGSDYYTVTTAYNGVLYKIKVFNRKINSVIGPLNLETGEQNIAYTFSDGFVIYGEKTTEKNFSMIEVPTLKHHKQNYIQAVKTQLLYFNNVKFFNEEESGERYQISFKADTIYNSKNLIVSTNSPYSKPHVVIVKGGDSVETQTGVCYGHIDFKEMEIQEMYGDVGIKCPIRQVIEDEDGNEIIVSEGVDVVPSRESVRWTPATRDFLKKQFQAAQDEATVIVEKELQETDFIKWIHACKNVTELAYQRDSIIGRLAKIVEINAVRPKYANTNIKFNQIKTFFRAFNISLKTKYLDKTSKEFKVRLGEMDSWSSVLQSNLYYKTTSSSRFKDVYVADQNTSHTFVSISPKAEEALAATARSISPKGASELDVAKKLDALKKEQSDIVKLLQASALYKSYDDVVVPEDYIANLKEVESKQGLQEDGTVILSNEERRKLEERVVCNTFESRYFPYETSEGQTFQKSKREPKFEYIDGYQGRLYYGVTEDMEKMQLACHFADSYNVTQIQMLRGRRHIPDREIFDNNHMSIFAISKSNRKYFKKHMHINDFFGKYEQIKNEDGDITGTKITMDDALIAWNTARKLKPLMDELNFMRNYSRVDENVHNDWKKLNEYVNSYYSNLSRYRSRDGMVQHYDELITFLDKIEKLQELHESGEADISSFIKDQELAEGLTQGIAVNREMLDLQSKLLSYAGPVKNIFNHIEIFNTTHRDIPLELLMEINDIVAWKKVTYEVEKEEVEENKELELTA